MSVSTEAVSPDLGALIAGGDAFIKRIAELKDAKEAYEKALANLNLGKSAQEAYVEASKTLEVAKKKRDDDLAALDKEVTEARKNLTTWSEQTKAEVMALNYAATQANADAKVALESAASVRESASKVLAVAEAKSATLLAQAQSHADQIVAEAKSTVAVLTKDVQSLKKETLASLEGAKAAEKSFKAKLAAIQAAASMG